MECSNRNHFCYVCGLFAPTKHMRNISKSFVNAFEEFFVISYVPNLWYSPEVVCDYCYRALMGAKCVKNRHKLKYVRPTIWLRRTEHSSECCYFCSTKFVGFRYTTREQIDYADVESVIKAQVSSDTASSENISTNEEMAIEMLSIREPSPSEFLPSLCCESPHFVTQADFNDLVRDTKISKETAEIIGSRLKQWNLVSEDFKITASRKRINAEPFSEYFTMHEDVEKQLWFCNDVDGLFKEIGHPHIPEEWRLFIDSSVSSLKVVLLHIGNIYPSVPIAYSTCMSENYDNMQLILDAINYNLHKWKVCCDLKVVALLTGVKKGYSRHQCFLCVWEGRKKELHYTNFEWHPRFNFELGQFSIDHIPLVESKDVILPPLHIKLGLIRSFIRTLNKESAAFQYLKTVFPKLSDAKVEAGRFNVFNLYNLGIKL